MFRSRARIAAAAVALAGLGAGIAGIADMIPSAHATSVVGVYRFAGTTRYDTAKLIGTYKAQGSPTFAFGAPTQAVLASGDNFPDALSSNFLAGDFKSPIFLTSTNTLRPEAVSGLQALGVRSVTIVGGPSAVSSDQDSQLTADGFIVQRVSGPDRDGTAAAVANAGAASIGTYNGQGLTAIIASDDNNHYFDALSAGPLSWAGHLPILLTPTDSLSAETKAALGNLGIKHVIIAGGTAAVSSSVQSAIEAMSISVERVAGADRQQTAIAVAGAELANEAFKDNQYDLAVGDNFPDALAGGPIGGLLKAPILLTADTNTLSTDTSGYLTSNNSVVNELMVYGGTGAVSDAVVAQAVGETTCNGGTPGTTSTTSTTSTSTTSTSTPSGSTTTTTTTILPLPTTTSSSTTSTTAGGSTTTLPPCTTTTTSSTTTSSTSSTTSTTLAVP
jgi:putative cell wall-binding protein